MKYGLITFDMYSALVDLNSSLIPPLTDSLNAARANINAATLLKTWRTKQREYLLISNSIQQGRVPFKQVTRRSLDYSLSRYKINLPEMDRINLVKAWSELDLWPEVPQLLHDVRAMDYPIAVLSNGDEKMLHRLIEFNELQFDRVFSSDQAGFYKPHPKFYHLPPKAMRLSASQVLHVAGSSTDALGAKAAGLACAWSNRSGDFILDAAFRPDYEFQELTDLLEVLAE